MSFPEAMYNILVQKYLWNPDYFQLIFTDDLQMVFPRNGDLWMYHPFGYWKTLSKIENHVTEHILLTTSLTTFKRSNSFLVFGFVSHPRFSMSIGFHSGCFPLWRTPWKVIQHWKLVQNETSSERTKSVGALLRFMKAFFNTQKNSFVWMI